MANDITRLRYFTGEFLQEADFKAEQAYHRRLRHLHNRWLHTWGIAFGLEVNPVPADPMRVTVEPGMGLVKVTEDAEELAKEVVLSTQRSVTLPGTPDAIVFILIGYDDTTLTDLQGHDTRTSEAPTVRAFVDPNVTGVPTNETELILAKIIMNAAGTGIVQVMGIPQIDGSHRKNAGMRGDVEATNVRFSSGVPSSQWPSIRSTPMPVGSLQISATQVSFSGNLTLGAGQTVDGVDVSGHNHTGGAGGQIDHNNLSNTDSTTGHILNFNAHDHTGGNGAAIPWTVISGPPNFLVFTALATVTVGAGGVINIQRSSGLAAVNPITRSAQGIFTVNWTTARANPVVLITIRSSTLSLSSQVQSVTANSATFNIKDSGINFIDAGFNVLIF